jgi:hypothetical protein
MLYAALKRTGQGPREVRVSDRKLITLQDAARWRVDVEGLRVFARRHLCR